MALSRGGDQQIETLTGSKRNISGPAFLPHSFTRKNVAARRPKADVIPFGSN